MSSTSAAPPGLRRSVAVAGVLLAVLMVNPASASAATVTATIALPRGAGELTAAFGSIWSADFDSGSVSRVDPSTNHVVSTIHTGGQPGNITAAAGSIWVTETGAGGFRDGHTLLRIDPATNRVTSRIRVGALPEGIALAGGLLWVANHHSGTLSAINPTTGSIIRTARVVKVPLSPPPNLLLRSTGQGVAGTPTALWVGVPIFNGVVRLNPATGHVASVTRVPLSNAACGGLAADADSVFVSAGGCGRSVVHIDASTGRVTRTVSLPVPPGGGVSDPALTADGGAWVLGGRTLARLSATGARISQTALPLHITAPYGLLAAAGSLWLTSFDNSNLYRVQP
jgi:YVTN family beta-propeller protein